MKKWVIILAISLVIIFLTGCNPPLSLQKTTTTEVMTTTNTEASSESHETEISEAQLTTATTQNSEPTTETTEASDVESTTAAENEEELIGHWEFVEKIIVEHEDHEQPKLQINYSFAFNNAATCDSTALLDAIGKEETAKITSKTQWSDPDHVYLPDDIIYLQLSAEIVKFDVPEKQGARSAGVSIWAYTAGVNASSLSPSSSNMQSDDMVKSAKAVIKKNGIKMDENGEVINLPSDDVEVSGTLGPGSDGKRRVIYVRSLLHANGHVLVKYIYEYKTSVLPEYDTVKLPEETTSPPEVTVEPTSDGYWKLKETKLIEMVFDDPTFLENVRSTNLNVTEDSIKYKATSLRKTLFTKDDGYAYIAECLWTEPKATYLPNEGISITLKAIIKASVNGLPMDHLIDRYDVMSFSDMVLIYALIDSDESGQAMAFCTEKITIFTNTETSISGVLGSGKKGDEKKIEIRYSFPELGGIDYTYEYVVD